MSRNRSEGWMHAKLSGHKNEELVKIRLEEDAEFSNSLCVRLGKPGIKSVEIGGLNEKSVECILGGKTKSKTDLIIKWSDDSSSNISIKKSTGGQVFLIKANRFIDGFELNYGSIPKEVQRALCLFFGASGDIGEILKSSSLSSVVSEKIRAYEIRKNRLVFKTLEAFDSDLTSVLLDWVKLNISNLIDFCFSKGLAKNQKDWADFVWYINLLNENNFDNVIPIKNLKAISLNAYNDMTFYGKVGGGTTIQIPFGFIQWHQHSIQFHHNMNDIIGLQQSFSN